MKEVIYSIFYFPLPIFWFLLIAMFLVNVKRRMTIFKIIILMFYISLTPLFANIIEYPLTRGDNFDYDNEKYSAVLVPTAGIYKDVNLFGILSLNILIFAFSLVSLNKYCHSFVP